MKLLDKTKQFCNRSVGKLVTVFGILFIVCGTVYAAQRRKNNKLETKVIPLLTSDPANEFFG